ncbi:hypothetical protein DIPPA_18531 [Diplonema papillatum]|nr:hypothetical protein DIPPA_18531 [Diplonema papillatum]
MSIKDIEALRCEVEFLEARLKKPNRGFGAGELSARFLEVLLELAQCYCAAELFKEASLPLSRGIELVEDPPAWFAVPEAKRWKWRADFAAPLASVQQHLGHTADARAGLTTAAKGCLQRSAALKHNGQPRESAGPARSALLLLHQKTRIPGARPGSARSDSRLVLSASRHTLGSAPPPAAAHTPAPPSAKPARTPHPPLAAARPAFAAGPPSSSRPAPRAAVDQHAAALRIQAAWRRRAAASAAGLRARQYRAHRRDVVEREADIIHSQLLALTRVSIPSPVLTAAPPPAAAQRPRSRRACAVAIQCAWRAYKCAQLVARMHIRLCRSLARAHRGEAVPPPAAAALVRGGQDLSTAATRADLAAETAARPALAASPRSSEPPGALGGGTLPGRSRGAAAAGAGRVAQNPRPPPSGAVVTLQCFFRRCAARARAGRLRGQLAQCRTRRIAAEQARFPPPPHCPRAPAGGRAAAVIALQCFFRRSAARARAGQMRGELAHCRTRRVAAEQARFPPPQCPRAPAGERAAAVVTLQCFFRRARARAEAGRRRAQLASRSGRRVAAERRPRGSRGTPDRDAAAVVLQRFVRRALARSKATSMRQQYAARSAHRVEAERQKAGLRVHSSVEGTPTQAAVVLQRTVRRSLARSKATSMRQQYAARSTRRVEAERQHAGSRVQSSAEDRPTQSAVVLQRTVRRSLARSKATFMRQQYAARSTRRVAVERQDTGLANSPRVAERRTDGSEAVVVLQCFARRSLAQARARDMRQQLAGRTRSRVEAERRGDAAALLSPPADSGPAAVVLQCFARRSLARARRQAMRRQLAARNASRVAAERAPGPGGGKPGASSLHQQDRCAAAVVLQRFARRLLARTRVQTMRQQLAACTTRRVETEHAHATKAGVKPAASFPRQTDPNVAAVTLQRFVRKSLARTRVQAMRQQLAASNTHRLEAERARAVSTADEAGNQSRAQRLNREAAAILLQSFIRQVLVAGRVQRMREQLSANVWNRVEAERKDVEEESRLQREEAGDSTRESGEAGEAVPPAQPSRHSAAVTLQRFARKVQAASRVQRMRGQLSASVGGRVDAERMQCKRAPSAAAGKPADRTMPPQSASGEGAVVVQKLMRQYLARAGVRRMRKQYSSETDRRVASEKAAPPRAVPTPAATRRLPTQTAQDASPQVIKTSANPKHAPETPPQVKSDIATTTTTTTTNHPAAATTSEAIHRQEEADSAKVIQRSWRSQAARREASLRRQCGAAYRHAKDLLAESAPLVAPGAVLLLQRTCRAAVARARLRSLCGGAGGATRSKRPRGPAAGGAWLWSQRRSWEECSVAIQKAWRGAAARAKTKQLASVYRRNRQDCLRWEQDRVAGQPIGAAAAAGLCREKDAFAYTDEWEAAQWRKLQSNDITLAEYLRAAAAAVGPPSPRGTPPPPPHRGKSGVRSQAPLSPRAALRVPAAKLLAGPFDERRAAQRPAPPGSPRGFTAAYLRRAGGGGRSPLSPPGDRFMARTFPSVRKHQESLTPTTPVAAGTLARSCRPLPFFPPAPIKAFTRPTDLEPTLSGANGMLPPSWPTATCLPTLPFITGLKWDQSAKPAHIHVSPDGLLARKDSHRDGVVFSDHPLTASQFSITWTQFPSDPTPAQDAGGANSVFITSPAPAYTPPRRCSETLVGVVPYGEPGSRLALLYRARDGTLKSRGGQKTLAVAAPSEPGDVMKLTVCAKTGAQLLKNGHPIWAQNATELAFSGVGRIEGPFLACAMFFGAPDTTVALQPVETQHREAAALTLQKWFRCLAAIGLKAEFKLSYRVYMKQLHEWESKRSTDLDPTSP